MLLPESGVIVNPHFGQVLSSDAPTFSRLIFRERLGLLGCFSTQVARLQIEVSTMTVKVLRITLPPCPSWYIIGLVDPQTLKKVMSELGKRGGPARAKSLTARERKEIATKASKAAARVRTAKANLAKKH